MELGLRFFLFSGTTAFPSLRDPTLYSVYPKDADEDFYNDKYWKLVHLFSQAPGVEKPHPLLGWRGNFDADDFRHGDHWKVGKKRPVLLFGDSFAQCVDSVECFQDILNADTAFAAHHYFLNYGVGRYGVDQISLLMQQAAPQYEHPFIVFSLLTTDLDRSMLHFRIAQKPWYTLTDNGLELHGTPITQPTKQFIEQEPPAIFSYCWQLLQTNLYKRFGNHEADERAYREDIKALNTAILEETFQVLDSMHTDYIVLIFHPEHHTTQGWRLNFLRDLCQ